MFDFATCVTASHENLRLWVITWRISRRGLYLSPPLPPPPPPLPPTAQRPQPPQPQQPSASALRRPPTTQGGFIPPWVVGRRLSASASALRRSPTAQGGPTPPGGWFPPQRWAELNFPRVSKSASPTPYTFDTLVTGMRFRDEGHGGINRVNRIWLEAQACFDRKATCV